MIVQRGEISRCNNNSKDSNCNSNHNNKDDICVTKAVARRSILMQIAKVRAANSFH
jgi:hypothetical protein